MSNYSQRMTSDLNSNDFNVLGSPRLRNDDPGYIQVLSFNGMIGFVRGAMNGTRLMQTNNLAKCQQKLVDKWDGNAVKMWNYTL